MASSQLCNQSVAGHRNTDADGVLGKESALDHIDAEGAEDQKHDQRHGQNQNDYFIIIPDVFPPFFLWQ